MKSRDGWASRNAQGRSPQDQKKKYARQNRIDPKLEGKRHPTVIRQNTSFGRGGRFLGLDWLIEVGTLHL
jgi:hypothetical protein